MKYVLIQPSGPPGNPPGGDPDAGPRGGGQPVTIGGLWILLVIGIIFGIFMRKRKPT